MGILILACIVVAVGLYLLYRREQAVVIPTEITTTEAPPVFPKSILSEACKAFPGARVCESPYDAYLANLAQVQAERQAQERQQGHQGFQERFEEIYAKTGMFATEICAESSKQHEHLPYFDIGMEMFRCWQYSPGHWDVASNVWTAYGDGLAKGSNGIWYACIIVVDTKTSDWQRLAMEYYRFSRSLLGNKKALQGEVTITPIFNP